MKTISREEQLERWRQRYGNRGIKGKAQLLDQLCQDYGYHRKHAIRLLNSTARIKKSPPGPESKYEGLVEVVQRIWMAAEQPCGKRLAEALPLWLPHYQRHYGRLLPGQRKLARSSQRGDAGPAAAAGAGANAVAWPVWRQAGNIAAPADTD